MSIFFDIGANTGTTSLQLLNDPNKEWIVYAFEPTPNLVDFLKKESNNNKNYNVIPVAVGNENKMIEMYNLSDTNISSSEFIKKILLDFFLFCSFQNYKYNIKHTN